MYGPGYVQTVNAKEGDIYIYFRPSAIASDGFVQRYGLEPGGLHERWADGRVRSQPIPLSEFSQIDGLEEALNQIRREKRLDTRPMV